jgi:hypothetical protein
MLRFDAVRLKGTGPEGAVHKRTLEAVSSPTRSYRAGEVLCNSQWIPEQLETAEIQEISCSDCARLDAEIRAGSKQSKSGGVDRPFFKAPIEELEKLLSQHRFDHAVLGRLREELTYRTTRRAKQLMREVEGIIEGRVPTEKKTRPAQPEDQLGLLGPDE